MSTHISKTTTWNNPYKYSVTLDADFEITSVVGSMATVEVTGTYTVLQSEHGSEMIAYPASDFGFLFEGRVIPGTVTAVIPGDHYMDTIPTLFGGSAEQYRSKMLVEFRGDTYRASGGNYTNLWIKDDGLVIDRKFGNTSTVVPINFTLSVDISGGGQAAILSWATTYVTFSPTTYHWGESVVWVSLADLDYRPGATLDTDTSIWKSHNRVNGACHILSDVGNMTWTECRTVGGAEGQKGNPPLILTAADASSWRNQKKLGKS